VKPLPVILTMGISFNDTANELRITNGERFSFRLYQLLCLKTLTIYGNATAHTNLNTCKYKTEISTNI